MSFTEDLIEGIAQLLVTGTVGFVYKTEEPYAPGERGVYIGTSPIAKTRPLSVVVNAYASADDFSLSDSVVNVQLDFEGPKDLVYQAVDDAFNLLHGRWGGTLGNVQVVTVARTSGADLSLDEAENTRQTENYELAVHRPSTHRQ